MLMSRRSVCQSLLLSPFAGILAAADPAVVGGTSVQTAANNQTKKTFLIVAQPGSSLQSPPGSPAVPSHAVGNLSMSFPQTINVYEGTKVKKKPFAKMLVDENFITNNGDRTLGNSQLIVKLVTSGHHIIAFFDSGPSESVT